eukprot:8383771-Alexandrium_andersonii.AAC.1
MCGVIRDPLICDPAIRNPANRYRLACVRLDAWTCVPPFLLNQAMPARPKVLLKALAGDPRSASDATCTQG